MQRIVPACVSLVAALLLSGCSAIDFAYNNAPGFVASEANEAFDLNDAQNAEVEARLQRFFSWHRQQELPRYREFFESAAVTIADGVSATEFLELSDELRLAWQRSLARGIEDLSDLALSLTPRQIEHYEQYFRDNSSEYDDYLQMSAQQREILRVQRGLERLEDWFGDFGYIQRKQISERLQQLPEFYPDWIRYREARQQAFVKALRAASTSGNSQQQWHFILLDPSTDYARPFEQARRAYWQTYGQMIEDISRGFSKAQLRHAVERLQNYAEIAEGLARND
jgi:uncharacterized protein YceK